MSEMFNYCLVVGQTDVGRKRAANEDNMVNAITQNGLVAVVCDGMGGHVGGAAASRIAVTAIVENLENVYYDDPRIAIGESIDVANHAIIRQTEVQPELTGMGSTCVMLLVRDGKVYYGHVGDSRIYLVRSKKIIQLTKDHSYVQMLVDRGQITKEEAERHPRKNEITNALGIPGMAPATVADDALIPEAGDCFLLCSDGLSGMVSDDAICKIVSRQSEMNAQERVDKLVCLANENGGVDNITVQMVEFSISPAIPAPESLPLWKKIGVGILLASLIGLAGYFIFHKKDKPVEPEEIVEEVKTPSVREVPVSLGFFKFSKKGRLAELDFTDTSLSFKRGDEVFYTETNVSFDRKSLEVVTPNIKAEFDNSLLSFTEKDPGDSIVFYITTSDQSAKYIFRFDKFKIDPSRISTGNERVAGSASPEPPVVNAPVEGTAANPTRVKTDTLKFELDALNADTKVVFNYSAKISVVVNSRNEKNMTQIIDVVLTDKLMYDDSKWTLDNKENQKQLVFSLQEAISNEQAVFMIPCKIKDSEEQLNIVIELVKSKDASEDITSPLDTVSC